MIFLGSTFCGGKNTGDFTPTVSDKIEEMTIKNGIFDNLFATKNTSIDITKPLEKTWNFDTIISAGFNGNLHCGNVEYAVSQISAIHIKRRKAGSYDWITLFDLPINKVNDLNFERIDKYAQSGVTYEYAFAPYLGNIEGNFNTNAVLSEFDGLFISTKDQTYSTNMNVQVTHGRHRPSSVVNTLGEKYPYVIYNGNNNYYSGSVEGTFVQFLESTCAYDFERGSFYRKDFLDFLLDGRPKFLKYHDGRAWIIAVVDDVGEKANGHEQNVITTFQWMEVGDINSGRDLYEQGLIDVGIGGG